MCPRAPQTLGVFCELDEELLASVFYLKYQFWGINEMSYCLSSEVLKGYSLFLIYKTNVFVKLLELF